MPGHGSWFDAFERNLAENGWLDDMRRDDLYEAAAKQAFDDVRLAGPMEMIDGLPDEEEEAKRG